MRRAILLIAGFLGLLAILVAMWAHRFEAVADAPVWDMASLRGEVANIPSLHWRETSRGPAIRLAADDGGAAGRIALPAMPAVDFIRLRGRLTAYDLTPGPEDWQCGRLIVEWRPASGGDPDLDPVTAAKYGLTSGDIDWILHPLEGPAVPVIHLGHNGKTGEVELSKLAITVVKERALWRYGRWPLALAWLGWAYLWVRSWRGVSKVRAFAAAVLVVVLGVKLMVPGPWRALTGLVVPFETPVPAGEVIAPGRSAESAATRSVKPIASTEVAPLGKIAEQGDWVLRVKLLVRNARPLLHLLMLMAPALALILLLGPRAGASTAACVALSIEAAQTMFGYGFGWDDVGDLACDALGIALALWLATRRGFPWLRRLLPPGPGRM